MVKAVLTRMAKATRPGTGPRQTEQMMAKTPAKPAPQQGGQGSAPTQQQGGSTSQPQQQGQQVIRDWAAF